MVDAVVADERRQVLAPHLRRRGVVDGDRVPTEVLHQPHTGNVGRPVAHVDHTAERDGTFALLDILIDQLAVRHRLDALVDLEDELRLIGIVDRHAGPVGDAVDVVEERAGVDLAELGRDGRPLDHLLQARRIDVVQHAHAPRGGVGVDAAEPLLHARKEPDVASRLLERLAAQRQFARARRFEHLGHVGKRHVGVLLLGQRIGVVPELPVALADGGNEIVLLHVAGRQRTVEVVDQRRRDFGFLCHIVVESLNHRVVNSGFRADGTSHSRN